MEPKQLELLRMPVAELPLSEELRELLVFHRYGTLGDVLESNVSFLRNNNGLTIHDELELFKLVKENGLREMWKGE